jgi:hypothetical protein
LRNTGLERLRMYKKRVLRRMLGPKREDVKGE